MIGIKGKVISLDSDTQAHINRCTGINDGSLYYHLDELITGLKSDNLWNKIDILCVVHDTEADSLKNLKGNALDADSSNILASFTANLGFTPSSGSGQYISLSQSETDTTNYTANSGHYMFYIQSCAANINRIMSTNLDTSKLVTTGTLKLGYIQYASLATTIGNATTAGFHGASIVASNDRRYRINGVNYAQGSDNTGTIGTATMSVGDQGAIGTGLTYSAWGVGDGLTATELANYNTRINTFATRRGFDV